jgi:hypothetical protein
LLSLHHFQLSIHSFELSSNQKPFSVSSFTPHQLKMVSAEKAFNFELILPSQEGSIASEA